MNSSSMWATFYTTNDRNNGLQIRVDLSTMKYMFSMKKDGIWTNGKVVE